MNIASQNTEIEKHWESNSDKSTANLMKNIKQGLEGPLSGFVKKLISGNYSKNMTDNLVKRANFFFWMSPNHSTLRLLTRQPVDDSIQ